MNKIISILWVDDEPDIQTGFVKECEENNLKLTVRKSYNSAKKEIEENHLLYDLFLLDARITESDDDDSANANILFSSKLRDLIISKGLVQPTLVRTGKIKKKDEALYFDMFGESNILYKGEEEKLFIKIKYEIGNSPKIQFKKKNPILIDILEKYFDENIQKTFVDLAITTNIDNHKYRYTELRKLLEYYLRKLNELEYLPDDLGRGNVNIGGSSMFFGGKKVGKHRDADILFKLNQGDEFNLAAQTIIEFLSKLFNTESHTSSKYFDHVKEVHTTTLFDSSFLILTELYVYTFNFYINRVNKNSWRIIDKRDYNFSN